MSKKPEKFKQKNPVLQLIACRGSLAGDLSNYDENIITAEQLIERLRTALQDFEAIEPHLQGQWKNF